MLFWAFRWLSIRFSRGLLGVCAAFLWCSLSPSDLGNSRVSKDHHRAQRRLILLYEEDLTESSDDQSAIVTSGHHSREFKQSCLDSCDCCSRPAYTDVDPQHPCAPSAQQMLFSVSSLSGCALQQQGETTASALSRHLEISFLVFRIKSNRSSPKSQQFSSHVLSSYFLINPSVKFSGLGYVWNLVPVHIPQVQRPLN